MFKNFAFVTLLLFQVSTSAYNNQECNLKLISSQFGSRVQSFSRGELNLRDIDKKAPEKVIEYISIKTDKAQEFTEREIFNDKSDLIIGIDVMGATKGHMYLVIDSEARVDGRMFYAPPTIEKEKWILSNGLILRYRNLPEANRQKLLAWLNSPQSVRGPSCVSVGGKIIFDIGDLGVPERNYWFPSTFLKFMAEKGLTSTDGVHLVPDVYLMNSDINLFWNNLPHVWTVPKFLFKVLFDPYTWKGLKKK